MPTNVFSAPKDCIISVWVVESEIIFILVSSAIVFEHMENIKAKKSSFIVIVSYLT